MRTYKTLAALALLPLAIACGGSAKEAKSAVGEPELVNRSAWSYINTDGDTRVYVDADELKKSAYFDAALEAIPVLIKTQSSDPNDALSPCITEELKSAQEFALSVDHFKARAPNSLIASVVTSSPQEHLDKCLTEKGKEAFATDPARFNGYPFKELGDLIVVRHGHALLMAMDKKDIDLALGRAPAEPPKLESGAYFLYQAKQSPNPAFGLTDLRMQLKNAGENTQVDISAETSSPGLARSMVRQATGIKRMAKMQLEHGKERYEAQVAQILGVTLKEIREKDLVGHVGRTIESVEIKSEETTLQAMLLTNTEFAAGYVTSVSEAVVKRYVGMSAGSEK